jgi:hypothetical protein
MNGIRSASRDPVVWTFVVLLGATMFFSIVGALQNHRISLVSLEIRAAQKYNQERLDYLQSAFQRREAELKAERDAKKSAVNP